jgi:GntR family transcriptional regulator
MAANSVPRYRGIAAELNRRIAQLRYAPGSLLPSEAELAAEFGVTRMTVRQALAGLAGQGLIERRHGHGTLVARPRLVRETWRPIGLAEELISRGQRPGSRTLSVEEMKPGAEVRRALRLGQKATVFQLARLRFADDSLIGYQETSVPTRYCPGLDALFLEDVSVSKLLRERYGLASSHADLIVEAVGATPKLANLLDVPSGAPLLRSTRVTYLADDRPLERTVGWFPGTRYYYRIRQGPTDGLIGEQSAIGEDAGLTVSTTPP